ncbi:sigma factor-like helix-turn-helix DNA-binding protein [Castellaniella defragrans]|uniref:sigma factor-like helix-turn-helix DNA-binding protein n=1 Tax=Castellaniella defragrans TaxID=75697 RepID=UPI002AFFD96D|nr:sigma factor-like helix-turn-helix DNA-binding protein [Castellaniella defragrans]
MDVLAAVILALPDRARDRSSILHRLYGMPQSAIAGELGLSLNAVAKHHAQAVRRIRELCFSPLLNPRMPPAPEGRPQAH